MQFTHSALLALALVTSVTAVPSNPSPNKPPPVHVVYKTVYVSASKPAPPSKAPNHAHGYQHPAPNHGHGHGPPQHSHPHAPPQLPKPAPRPAPPQNPTPPPPPPPKPAPVPKPPQPAPSPPPPAPKPAPQNNNDGWPSYMKVVNQYRQVMGMAPLQWDQTLDEGAQRVVHTCDGTQFHNDGHDGWRGQVLCPAEEDQFKEVFLFGWLCERPTLPGISQLCPLGASLFEHLPGVTGHADILTDPQMKNIGCAYYKGIWGCDLS